MNRPFLLYQLEILAKAGITDITLSLNYQPDKIENVLGDGSDYGVNLSYVTEPSPLGTAGAYRYAASDMTETTIVFNGDILTDVDVSSVIATHKAKKAEATIMLTPVEDPSAYGLVETAEDGSVRRFLEKPKPEQLVDLKFNTINAGVYVLEPKVLELIPEGENCSFEYDVFPHLLEHSHRFYSFILDKNYWRDIGTPASYLTAHLDFLHERIKGFNPDQPGDSEVATTAQVDNSSKIGTGCVIKPGARIINSVLGPGVHVDEKALIENSVLWPHTRVSSLAEIHDAVIARSCHIGKSVYVGAGTVLGDKASLPDYSRV
jgi:NDP-sugar pyrophosphorylase family protein